MFRLRELLLAMAAIVAVGFGTLAEAGNIAPAGLATQSTTGFGLLASNAIDGNLGNFTHTTDADPNPTWELTLPMNADIDSVILFNRSNCCGSRLRDITVEILDVDTMLTTYASGLLNPENAGFVFPNGPGNITLDLVALTGGSVSGGIVRVMRTRDDDLSGTAGDGNSGEPAVLSLGEVRVFSETIFPFNLALGKSASQSTTLSATYVAARAVDGNLGNFTHTTTSDPDPTWMVNLGRSAIDTIILNNRTSCCGERLRDIVVSVEDDFGNTVFTSELLNAGGAEGSPAALTLDLVALTGGSVMGSKVVVNKQAPAGTPDAAVLSLGEVQAIGLPLENIALNKPATQSSGYLGDQFPAGNATNGNLNDFTHTDGVLDTAPSLLIDLEDTYAIDDLFLHNRLGCCGGRFRDLIVEILGPNGGVLWTSELLNPDNILGDGGYDQASIPQSIYLELGGVIGQFIRISRITDLPGNIGAEPDPLADQIVLSIGEVVVYGTQAVLIPEPGSMLLLLGGGLLMARRRRA